MRIIKTQHAMSALQLTAVIAWIVLANGCSGKDSGDAFLLQVGSQSISVAEFKRDVEAAAEEAFPGEREPDVGAVNDLRVRVLNQLSEELIICEYAKSLGLQVSDAELQEAVAAIKADYPDKTFEETLLENAVSFQVWKQKLARRLLVQKVINKELIDRVEITSDDVAEYYKTHYPQGTPSDQSEAKINKKIITHLRQQKAEKMYQDWIDNLRKTYTVSVNQERWNNMVGESN